MLAKKLEDMIRKIPDYPKPGILFYDITTMLKDPEGFRLMVDMMAIGVAHEPFDVVAGIDARGFIMGAALAHHYGKGFVPIRKKGKLPYQTVSATYELEYGVDAVEMHTDAVSPGTRVLVVDDLLATGGTASAACQLIQSTGGKIAGCAFVVELAFFNGRKKLPTDNVVSLIQVKD